MEKNNDINKYFIILGIEMSASDDEIRSAYMNMVQVWHPDKHQGDPNLSQFAQKHMKDINEAYNNIKYFRASNNRSEDLEIVNSDGTSLQKQNIPKDKYMSVFPVAILLFCAALVILIILGRKIALTEKFEPPPPPPPLPAVSTPGLLEAPVVILKKKPLINPKENSKIDTKDNKHTTDKTDNGNSANKRYFFIGSTMEDVLIVQGTPTRIQNWRTLNEEWWDYGDSRVVFNNGFVKGYDNKGELNVQISFKNINKE